MSSHRINDSPGEACRLSRRWRISPIFAGLLVALDRAVREIFSTERLRFPGLYIISGYRSPRLQARVNPSAPGSLHTRCPSLAVDMRVGDLPASVTPPELWSVVGNTWKALGGRWGGDFAAPDLNHFALPDVPVSPVVGLGVTPVPRVAIPRQLTPPQVSLRPALTISPRVGRSKTTASILI